MWSQEGNDKEKQRTASSEIKRKWSGTTARERTSDKEIQQSENRKRSQDSKCTMKSRI
jgi:hypothetical protein